MPNHVHLILTPTDTDGLRRALAKVHRAYAGTIHSRQKKTGLFDLVGTDVVSFDALRKAESIGR